MTEESVPRTDRPRTMTDLRAVCLKRVDAWDSRHLYRPISLRITWLLVRTPISPNLVTVSGGVIGALGALLFALPTLSPSMRLVGLLLIQLAIVFDHVDGELARATRRFSGGGVFLDAFVTEIFLHLSVTAALAMAVYLQFPRTEFLIAGALLVFLKALSIATFYLRGFLTERMVRTADQRPDFAKARFSIRIWIGSLFWEVRRLSNTILVMFAIDVALTSAGIPFPAFEGFLVTPLVVTEAAALLFLATGLVGSAWDSGRGRFLVNMDPFG